MHEPESTLWEGSLFRRGPKIVSVLLLVILQLASINDYRATNLIVCLGDTNDLNKLCQRQLLLQCMFI